MAEKIFEMIKSGNPREVYKKMMLRSLELNSVNQLGLARIRYECSTEISYKVSKDVEKHFEEIKITPGQAEKMLILSVELHITLYSTV